MRFGLWRTASLWLLIGSIGCGEALERHRVIILVVDGLRPDYVTAELMPRLNELAEAGVRGTAHHAVFPTVTRVNGPSIFTGRYPVGHGMMGNSVYLPDVDASRVLNAGDRADLGAIGDATGGELLTAPSLGELLEERGLTFFAASSGSTGSATLMNHRGSGAGLVHHAFTIPDSLAPVVNAALGPAPEIPSGEASVLLVARTIDALLEIGLDRVDADVLAAWLTEPDGTAHANGIGAPETVEVLAAVDAEIGRLLDGLDDRGVLSHTDILVTSDHGFTTRTGNTNVGALLVQAGLKESAASMDVVIADGAVHVRAGGRERMAEIVRLLQRTEWIGPVFTGGEGDGSGRGLVEGTVAYSEIGWDHDRAGDILTSADWSDGVNEHGYAGEVFAPGVAGHGSSSPWDIRATFLAVGPHIKSGMVSAVPTGNIDLVPTTLELMGAPVPLDLDGRVLHEVLASGPAPTEVSVRPDSIVVSVDLDGLRYELTVERSYVGATMYFDGTRVRRTRSGRE